MARTSLLQWKAPRLYKQTLSSAVGFTTNYAVDDTYLTKVGHGLTAGDLVEFQEVGTLPTPLLENEIYSVFEKISDDIFTVTLDGINVIVITDNGGGTDTYKSYSTNVVLENFTVTQDSAEDKAFWHESVINNHREIVNTDKMHWYLEFNINLFKEGTLTTRRANFDELFGYLYQDVYVSRFNEDGVGTTLIRDSSSDPVTFVMDKFETSFLTQANYEDLLTIGLRSKDVIDMSKTV